MIAIAMNVFLAWLPIDNRTLRAAIPQHNRLDAVSVDDTGLEATYLQLDRTQMVKNCFRAGNISSITELIE